MLWSSWFWRWEPFTQLSRASPLKQTKLRREEERGEAREGDEAKAGDQKAEGERAKRGAQPVQAAQSNENFDFERAAKVLPVLRLILQAPMKSENTEASS